MRNNSLLQSTLYQTILTQCYTGALQQGDLLLQRQLSDQYQVAMPVVRGALRKLAQNGYITTAQDRSARVTYTPKDPTFARALLLRRHAILDAFDGLSVLFTGIYTRAAQLVNETQNQRLAETIAHLPDEPQWSDAVAVGHAFLATLLDPLQNPLLLSLQRELQEFTRIPSPYLTDNRAFVKSHLIHLHNRFDSYLTCIRQGETTRLIKQFSGVYPPSKRVVSAYFAQLESPIPDQDDSVAFEWIGCKGRHQDAHVALKLLRLIDTGIYTQGELLPSVCALAERHCVSVDTARNAYVILGELGFTRTTNGVGTHVRYGKMRRGRSFSREKLLDQFVLHLNALQILALSVRSVALFTFPKLGPPQRELLAHRLQLTPSQLPFCVLTTYLGALAEFCGSASIRSVYVHLIEQLFWGYHLRLGQKHPALRDPEHLSGLRAHSLLQAGDAEGFADELEQLAMGYYIAHHRGVRALGAPAAALPHPLG